MNNEEFMDNVMLRNPRNDDVAVDNLVVRTTKKGARYINFNVVITYGNEKLYYIGFQTMGGLINPPSYRVGWRFVPIVHVSQEIANLIYLKLQEVLRVDIGKELFEEFLPLLDMKTATDPLVMRMADFVRLFPVLASDYLRIPTLSEKKDQ